jgi:hypothetical protein
MSDKKSIDVPLGRDEQRIASDLPSGWHIEWICITEGQNSTLGTWCILTSPDGIERSRARTLTRAIVTAMDQLWVTIAGALT